MKDVRLSISIMAHPSRKPLVDMLKKRLDAHNVVVWDKVNNVWDTGRRALLEHQRNATHHLVLQDDVYPAKNLIAACRKLLQYVPENSPVSLYMGRSRTSPARYPMSPIVDLGRQRRASFAVFDGPWWGPGVIVPTHLISDLVAFGDRRVEIPQYDHKISYFFSEQKIPCYYTLPCLVDHITLNTPSLLGHGNGKGRSAPWFSGIRTSAALRAWNNKIITPDDLPRQLRRSFPRSPSYPKQKIAPIVEKVVTQVPAQKVSKTIVIPKIIHHIWVGSDLPERFKPYVQSWKDTYPDWDHIFWDDKDLKGLSLTNQHLVDNPTHFVPSWGVGQFISDVVRLELLHKFGGMYVDTDFEILRPMDDLIAGVELFAAWELQGQWLANGLMGSTANHPFIKELITRLPANVRKLRGQRPATISGPKFLTHNYRQLQPKMHCIPQTSVFPYSWSDLGTSKSQPPWPASAYAVHHWNNQRQAHELGEKR